MCLPAGHRYGSMPGPHQQIGENAYYKGGLGGENYTTFCMAKFKIYRRQCIQCKIFSEVFCISYHYTHPFIYTDFTILCTQVSIFMVDQICQCITNSG